MGRGTKGGGKEEMWMSVERKERDYSERESEGGERGKREIERDSGNAYIIILLWLLVINFKKFVYICAVLYV